MSMPSMDEATPATGVCGCAMPSRIAAIANERNPFGIHIGGTAFPVSGNNETAEKRNAGARRAIRASLGAAWNKKPTCHVHVIEV